MWRRRCLSWPGPGRRTKGLANIEFRSRDATRTGLPDGGFDAVVCVFGVFFAADMTAFLREIWRLGPAGRGGGGDHLGPGVVRAR
jgi:ubiquinone/menaquinone biosynthesis C-methylase UbiE